jgi:hypothetical protein
MVKIRLRQKWGDSARTQDIEGLEQFKFTMDKEPRGLYFCKIKSTQEQKVIKFIKN